jgi:superfamily II DNA/RNA helicase
LEHSGSSETINIEENGKGRGEEAVEHVCWVVDPDSGEHTDLSEPVALDGSTGNSRPGVMTNDESQEALAATSPGPGEVHPYLIESLALHWASRSGSGKSLVIPPNGTSVRKLQDTLSELGCPSVSLDVDSRETARQVGLALQEGRERLDEANEEIYDDDDSEIKEIDSDQEGAMRDTLYILPRSHIRGIDIPDIKTVYLLGGLGIKDVKGASTGAAVWAERKREYLHWVGRMGRLSGTKVSENRAGTTGKDTIVTLVLKGPEEILMRKFMEKIKEKRQKATVSRRG